MKKVAHLSLIAIISIIFIQPVSAQINFKSYKPGRYYTSKGKKWEGLLKLKYDQITDNSDGAYELLFKEEKKGMKYTFKTTEICCFVIEKDSFAVVRNFTLDNQRYFPREFAQVIEVGKINLYQYVSKSLNPAHNTTNIDWVIEKGNEAEKVKTSRV
jgi:hypothetical protein